MYIMCYSLCKSFYFCNFKGVDEIGQILGDKNWEEHNYGKEQLSFIHLHVLETISSDVNNSSE